MADAGLPKLSVRALTGGDEDIVRVWGRGGPHDWAPPPLPSCAKMQSRHERSAALARRQLLRLKQEELDARDFHGFGGDIEGLRAFLNHKYGGSIRGWRRAIAPDKAGLGPVLLSDFCQAMKRIGYAGPAMSLWKALRKNSGNPTVVRLEHFEPDFAVQMDALAKIVYDVYEGGTPQIWRDMERYQLGRATFSEWDTFLTENDLFPRKVAVDSRRVFEALDMAGAGSVTEQDLFFIDHWAHYRHGTVLPAPPVDPRDLPAPPHWSPPAVTPTPVPGLSEFRTFLTKKFGSPARGWRVALDIKGCGVVSIADFGMGCRSIGWRHAHGGLYHELEEAGDGYARLRGLDPDTAAAIDEINDIIFTTFGSLEAFWKACDTVDAGSVSVSHFVEFGRALSLQASRCQLVCKVLDTAGTNWLTFGELGFLQSFERGLADLTRQGGLAPAGVGRSASSPALVSSSGSPGGAQKAGMTQFPKATASVSSPAKSSRSVQSRAYANTHLLKHRWVAQTGQRHCVSKSISLFQSAQAVNQRAIRSTPQGDIFRSTNQYYREGVKRLLSLQRRRSSDEDLFEDDAGDDDDDDEEYDDDDDDEDDE